MNKNIALVLTSFLIIVVFLFSAYQYNKQQKEVRMKSLTENAEALVRANSPQKGNPKAKVTLVEFLDPACETCKVFHPYVKKLLSTYRGKLKVVVRYAPLHQGSDYMVKILEAAKMQGQFWSVLNLMFDTQDKWATNHKADINVFWSYLEKTNLDLDRLQKDIDSKRVAQIVAQDIKDGQLLGATKTPTFFVNGKPLVRFGYQELKDLVDSEIRKNY